MTTADRTSEPRTRFELSHRQEADVPPEARGLARDGVRLLVSDREKLEHSVFRDIPRFLRAGDLLVVNTSATLPAAVDAEIDGEGRVVVHFSTPLGSGPLGGQDWAVEVRGPGPVTGPLPGIGVGTRIRLPRNASVMLLEPWPPGSRRLWRARVDGMADVTSDLLAAEGRPVTYAYVSGRWPLPYYQTVFGRDPGSAEMPSAGRPFTDVLIADLVARSVLVAPVLLHTGVSSPEAGEPPLPERYAVPATTARLVNETRAAGGRVIAVGTTVTRALETAATVGGRAVEGAGWTDLVLGRHRRARVVDGLVTGWHAPGASHLMLLEAVVGESVVRRAYEAALTHGYLWHEFGDSALLLR
ncbi:S-adenosylmethionine:tRNA ribosyltransferase-isomerase [Rhodococcus spelaei]|uniref:S-adenosylmethionine:tRNA ribosyltransferase-isomerase n=1 Tax=Rhodococcus spelaei TaxID=2546320 RepID=A0A541B4D3_9NOCA|nr:S-adenosylmethionine:tRNA ribosyltransferase-isomerase [Rhodococcus spelaei]TQF67184.1 S-adenosylmethionine:tRNA ribosyltransferase-isomerase [Rhodococcus spelaei]